MDDAIDEALLEHELGALKTGRQVLADGLADHACARKPDQRAGLRDDHVAERRVRGQHARHRGIGEDGDERQSLGAQAREQRGGLGHLHEREDAFLHARAAGGGDQHERAALRDGPLDRARHLLAHHRAHAPAHEEEIHDREAHRLAADGPDAGDRRVLLSGVAARGLQPLRIGHAGVPEPERISGHQAAITLRERLRIDEELEIGAGRDAEMVVAMRAGPEVLLQHALIERFAASFAFGPQPFGQLGPLDLLGLDTGSLTVEP